MRALQRALGIPADGVFGPQTAARRQALPAPPRADRRRHRRPADPRTRSASAPGPCSSASAAAPAGAAAAAPRAAARRRAHRGRRRALAAARARPAGRRCLRPADRGRREALPEQPRAHAGRRGRTADAPGARPRVRPVLKRRGVRRSAGGGGGGTLQRVIAAANRIARKPYQATAAATAASTTRLRLLGLDLLRAARRRPAALPARLERLHELRRPGRGRHITIYANAGHAFMVVDGRRYDTSAIGETGSRWTSTHRSSQGYVVRHPRGSLARRQSPASRRATTPSASAIPRCARGPAAGGRIHAALGDARSC